MNKSNTTIKFILISTCIYMLTTCCFYYANANPHRVGCDLKGTVNLKNVMTQDTIMHATPKEVKTLISIKSFQKACDSSLKLKTKST